MIKFFGLINLVLLLVLITVALPKSYVKVAKASELNGHTVTIKVHAFVMSEEDTIEALGGINPANYSPAEAEQLAFDKWNAQRVMKVCEYLTYQRPDDVRKDKYCTLHETYKAKGKGNGTYEP